MRWPRTVACKIRHAYSESTHVFSINEAVLRESIYRSATSKYTLSWNWLAWDFPTVEAIQRFHPPPTNLFIQKHSFPTWKKKKTLNTHAEISYDALQWGVKTTKYRATRNTEILVIFFFFKQPSYTLVRVFCFSLTLFPWKCCIWNRVF